MTPHKRPVKRIAFHYGSDDESKRANYAFVFSSDINDWCNSKYKLSKDRAMKKEIEERFKKDVI